MEEKLQKHILVTSQCFYPEQFRINDICIEWVKKGYKVTVLTGIPNYPQGKFYKGYGLFKKRREMYNGMEIIRIPVIPRGNNVVMLSLNYISFVISGFFWKVFTKLKTDYVFMFETSPMTQCLVGSWFSKRRKIPCYIYVQDLWPENVEIITGIKSKLIIGPIGKMVDYIYESCNKIFTTSKSFKESVNKRGVPNDKIEYLPQYAEDFYVPIEKSSIDEIPNDDKFNIIFAGNIGQAQGLDILPKAASIIKEKGYGQLIRFNIVGNGRYLNKLLAVIDEMDVSDIFNFVPRQPPERIPVFFAATDCAFLSLSDSPLFRMTIPAKLQSYLACGMPIIASVAGESADIINESQAGVCSSPGDYNKLAENMIEYSKKSQIELEKIGENAQKYYKDNFDKNMLLNKLDKYFID